MFGFRINIKQAKNNMFYIDCRMLQGSGISTYLMGLIRIYKKKHEKHKRHEKP